MTKKRNTCLLCKNHLEPTKAEIIIEIYENELYCKALRFVFVSELLHHREGALDQLIYNLKDERLIISQHRGDILHVVFLLVEALGS